MTSTGSHLGLSMLSGGAGSWLASRRAREIHGDDLELVFADVKGAATSRHLGEDEDTYRFLVDTAADVFDVALDVSATPQGYLDRAEQLVEADPLGDEDDVVPHARYLYLRDVAGEQLPRLRWLVEGRDIWTTFDDDRFLGNSRLANCSKLLKQIPARRWIERHDPASTTVYVGIDWSESHRLPAIVSGYSPYRAEAPLTDPPYLDKPAMMRAIEEAGIAVPRAYRAGFAHNNCGGFCVRAGQAQNAALLREHPARYRFHEQREEWLRGRLGKDVSVMTDRTLEGRLAAIGLTPAEVDAYDEEPLDEDSVSSVLVHRDSRTVLEVPNRVPLTLRSFRERQEAAASESLFDEFDLGGCGCFVDEGDEAARA